MGLGEKALGVQGDLVEFRQGRVLVGNDGGGQGQKVHREAHRPLQDLIRDRDLEAAVRLFHPGRVRQVIADENHPQFPGPLVESFPFAIGAHIPVEDINLHLRVHLFQLDGVLHGMGAAHLVAVGPLRGAGAHALDEGHGLGLLQAFALLDDLPVQVQGQQDVGVLFVEVLAFGPQRLGADGDDHDAVVDRLRRWTGSR